MAFPDINPQSEFALHQSVKTSPAPALPWFETIAFLAMIVLTTLA